MLKRYIKFGPCYVRREDVNGPIDRGPIGGRDPGSGAGQTTTDPAPTPVPTPVINVQEVSGGLSPQQVDQLAEQFETEEGGALVVAYGEHLVAGNLVSHKYDSVTPENNYTVALGEGHGGLGGHGEWDDVVKAYHAGEELTRRFEVFVWVEDALPAGAVADPGQDGWNWVSDHPKPFFGKYSHQSAVKTGDHQHFFQDATTTLIVAPGDSIFCWVFLDPASPPQEVLLEFRVGASWEHRAYWGANLINLGTNGTDSRRQISASLPATGSWQRLGFAASDLGLEGATINGMAFHCFDGGAAFDQVSQVRGSLSPGYHFHRGQIASAFADVQQGETDSLPIGVAGSGTPIIFVRLDTDQSAEDRPDKFRGRFKTRRTFDYDATGEQIGYGYSTNPARVAADRILNFFQRTFRNDLDLAQQKFRARIDWPSWVRWRDFCGALIPWNKDGSENIFIPRFEAHIAFTGDLLLADALDQICGLSATFWQDDGEQLLFVPPGDQLPVHHFNESNITRAPQVSPQDLRQTPNFFVARYREFDDEFLGEVSTSVKREDTIRRLGEVRSQRSFANMRQSQAQRLLERQARIEHDNPVFCSLTGDATSVHVIPGDFVTVSHSLPRWDHQLCLVVDITVQGAETSADEVEFTLQQISGDLYSDTAHTPVQEALVLP